MIATRTQVRQRLEQYNKGKLSLKELAEDNKKSLADSLNSTKEIAGISQFDSKGNLIVQCGLPIEKILCPIPPLGKIQPSIKGLVTIDKKLYIPISAPIINNDSIRLGTVTVIFTTSRLERIIQNNTGLGETGRVFLKQRNKRENIVVLPPLTGKTINSPAQLISISIPISSTDWWLVGEAAKNELYSPVMKQVTTIILLLVILILFSSYGITLLLKPLTGKTLTHTDLLKKQVQRKTIAWLKESYKRKQTEKRFEHLQKSLRTILDFLPFGVLIINKNFRVHHVNQAGLKIMGYQSENEILGKMCNKTFCPIEEGQCPIIDLKQTIEQSEKVLIKKNGEIIDILKSAIPITLENREVFLAAFVNITERKKAEEYLERLSALDGLTGIANRRCFDQFLDSQWVKSQTTASPLSLIMIDIDIFKSFNDTYGHQKGDDCLKLVANTLDQIVSSPPNLVARYGGEEFAAVLPNTTTESAFILAEKMRKSIEELEIQHSQSPNSKVVTVSIGVATVIPDKCLNSFHLIQAADQALYQAKELGRNRVTIFKNHKELEKII